MARHPWGVHLWHLVRSHRGSPVQPEEEPQGGQPGGRGAAEVRRTNNLVLINGKEVERIIDKHVLCRKSEMNEYVRANKYLSYVAIFKKSFAT